MRNRAGAYVTSPALVSESSSSIPESSLYFYRELKELVTFGSVLPHWKLDVDVDAAFH